MEFKAGLAILHSTEVKKICAVLQLTILRKGKVGSVTGHVGPEGERERGGVKV